MPSLLSKTDGVFHNDPEWDHDQHQTFALSKNAHMGPVCFWGIKSDNIISYRCSLSALSIVCLRVSQKDAANDKYFSVTRADLSRGKLLSIV